MNQFANRLVAVIVSIVLMVAGFMFSVVAFGVIAILALVIGGWFWWKTRAIRRQMREQMQDISQAMAEGRREAAQAAADEHAIEGEFVRESEKRDPQKNPADDSHKLN